MKIDGFTKMPVLEYFSILDSRIAENRKAVAEEKAKARRSRK